MRILGISEGWTSGYSFITLKDNDWLMKQRIAGKCVASCLNMLKSFVLNKENLSLLEMDKEAESFILKSGCTPTFKNYKGFPNSVCISVNNQLVHGIPTDYKLKDGDVVSFDLGATLEGVIGDAAITVIYGEPKNILHEKLLKVTEECLDKAIQNIAVNKRLGVIGNTIYKHAKDNGFAVVEEYGGHSLSYNCPHHGMFVSNKSSVTEGIVMQEGLTLAIEPLLCTGSNKTEVSKDGWTVITNDINCHFEKTIYIHKDSVEIIT